MLYEIALENFKPFAERQVAPLSKITLIYGPNSAGKSSLIQALMLLRQTLDGSATQKRKNCGSHTKCQARDEDGSSGRLYLRNPKATSRCSPRNRSSCQ